MEEASLDPASILEEATRLTALRDFGDESFREPFERLCAALDSEARLNAAGRAAQRQRVLDILLTRARSEVYFQRHPEILDEQIAAPVVIVGLPRSGTTMLHRVIAEDPDFDSVKWYECRFPAPPTDWDWVSPDPRVAAAEREIAQMLEFVPELASVHPFDPVGPDEEIMLLEQAFCGRTAESYADIPSFRAWQQQQDQRWGYAYLKRMLQFLQWQHRKLGRSRERWVLKTPHHLTYMDCLFETFPDATVVQTHRDPVQAIPSIASMIHHLWELGCDDPDPKSAGRQWNENFAVGLRATLKFRDEGRENRFADVWFRDSVRDPIGTVGRVYEFLGKPLTPIAEDKMRRWTEDNAREKRSPHEYTLEKFGLTEAGIARDFSEYRERFIFRR
jgi:hypothetical protein